MNKKIIYFKAEYTIINYRIQQNKIIFFIHICEENIKQTVLYILLKVLRPNTSLIIHSIYSFSLHYKKTFC